MVKVAIIGILNSAFFVLPATLGCGVDPEAEFPVQQTGPSPLKMDLQEEGTLVLQAEDGKKLVSATHVLPNGNGTLVVADEKSGNVVEVTADGLVIGEYRHLEGEGRNFTRPRYLIWTPNGGLIVLDSRYSYKFDKDKKYMEKRSWWYVEKMEYNGAGRYAKLVSKGRFLFKVGPTEDGEYGLLAVDNMSLVRKYENKGMVLRGDSLVVTTNLDNALRVYDIKKGQLIGKYLVDARQVSNDLFSEVDSRHEPRFVKEWANAAHLLDLHYLQEVGLYIVFVQAPETEEMREESEGFGYYLVYDDQFRRVGRIDLDYGWLVGTADEGLLYMRQKPCIDNSGDLADPVVKVYRIAVSDAYSAI